MIAKAWKATMGWLAMVVMWTIPDSVVCPQGSMAFGYRRKSPRSCGISHGGDSDTNNEFQGTDVMSDVT